MKKSITLLLLLISGLSYGQKKYPKIPVDTIRVNKDSIEYSCKHGSLAFFSNCEWTINMNVNGSGIDMTQKNTSIYNLLRNRTGGGKRGIYIYNIKMKNPDGTFKYLTPKQIIIE